jgi:hypothetical protein
MRRPTLIRATRPLDSVYFNTARDLPDTVDLILSGKSVPTKGITLALGQSTTLTVRFFSTAATANWEVYAVDESAAYGGSPLLKFTPNVLTGNNGDVATMTVTALATDPATGGAEIYARGIRCCSASVVRSFRSNDFRSSDIKPWHVVS